jgi:hypothetical protein
LNSKKTNIILAILYILVLIFFIQERAIEPIYFMIGILIVRIAIPWIYGNELLYIGVQGC